MAQAEHKIYNRGGRSSDFIIRVKSGEGMSVKGKVEHIQSGQVQYFNDYLEMLMLIQGKLDENNYPQRDTELRTYRSSD